VRANVQDQCETLDKRCTRAWEGKIVTDTFGAKMVTDTFPPSKEIRLRQSGNLHQVQL
jgi:hypothetical protein